MKWDAGSTAWKWKSQGRSGPTPMPAGRCSHSQKRSQGQGKAGVACRPCHFLSSLIPATAPVMMCVRFCGCAIPCFGGILEKGVLAQ